MKLLILAIIALPPLLSMLIKHWITRKHTAEPEIYVENDIAAALGKQLERQRFEAALQQTEVDKQASRLDPRWRTSAEMMPEEQLQRKHGAFAPSQPIVIYDDTLSNSA